MLTYCCCFTPSAHSWLRQLGKVPECVVLLTTEEVCVSRSCNWCRPKSMSGVILNAASSASRSTTSCNSALTPSMASMHCGGQMEVPYIALPARHVKLPCADVNKERCGQPLADTCKAPAWCLRRPSLPSHLLTSCEYRAGLQHYRGIGVPMPLETYQEQPHNGVSPKIMAVESWVLRNTVSWEYLWQLTCAGMWQSHRPRRHRRLVSRLCKAGLLYEPEQCALKHVTALWPLRHAGVAYGCQQVCHRATQDIYLHDASWHKGKRTPWGCRATTQSP